MSYNPDDYLNKSDDPTVLAAHQVRDSEQATPTTLPTHTVASNINEALANEGEKILMMDRSRV